MSTISSFKDTKNKHDVYRGKDFMKMFMFCESLREHAIKVINFLKMKVLTNEQQNHMKMQKSAIFIDKSFKIIW